MGIVKATVTTIENRSAVNGVTTIALLFLHIGAIAAFFYVTIPAVLTGIALYWICIGFGIGLGYHRLHTHRSYEVPKWLEYFFALCGTMTLEGGPIFWVATHRVHHQKSDQPGDPHSPRDGRFWSHMGWIIFGEAKHNNTAVMSKYAPDLARDPFYRWLNTYHFVPLVLSAIPLYYFGGIPMLLWGGPLRIVLGLHATWLVNSATHLWGSRRFKTRDDSRNNWWVAFLTMGEGWHNNHHAHPTSARHGLVWYEVDITWMTISLLNAIGLAKKVKVAKVTSVVNEEDVIAA